MCCRYSDCRSVRAICAASRLSTSRPRFMIPMRVAVSFAWNKSCVVVSTATPRALAGVGLVLAGLYLITTTA